MYITTRESCLFREGFKSTSQLFALLGRDDIGYSCSSYRDNMGLNLGGRELNGDWSFNDKLLTGDNMEYWYWRRKYRHEKLFKRGTDS